jgi:hypothetical protein
LREQAEGEFDGFGAGAQAGADGEDGDAMEKRFEAFWIERLSGEISPVGVTARAWVMSSGAMAATSGRTDGVQRR